MRRLGIHYSTELWGAISSLAQKECKIAKMLYNYEVSNDEVDYLDFDLLATYASLSFLPDGKISAAMKTGERIYESRYRQSAKLGKILNKILVAPEGESIKDADIKEFVELFQSTILNPNYEIEVVSGIDMLPFYLDTNYVPAPNSELGKSCMRHKKCQKWLDMYTSNPNLSMLIAKQDGKLAARSLIWGNLSLHPSLKGHHGNKILEQMGKTENLSMLDRVYAINPLAKSTLVKWGRDNCDLVHHTPKTPDYFTIVGHDSDERQACYVTQPLQKYQFYYYPYVDTLCYFNRREMRLSNYSIDCHAKFQNGEGGYDRLEAGFPSYQEMRAILDESTIRINTLTETVNFGDALGQWRRAAEESQITVHQMLETIRELYNVIDEVPNSVELNTVPIPPDNARAVINDDNRFNVLREVIGRPRVLMGNAEWRAMEPVIED